MPNLIVNDLFLVQPMASFSGNLVYMSYGLGQEKGGVGGRDADGHLKTVTNNPWMLAPQTKERSAYTSEAVVETHKIAADEATDHYVEIVAAWTPVADVKKVLVNNVEFTIVHKASELAAGKVFVEVSPSDKKSIGFEFMSGAITADQELRFGYFYDNIVVPQDKLPTFIGEMKNIPVAARARRIAIVYSQIAAFQAKTDYGMDFESTIAQQAQAELSYEIDAEAVFLIKDAADAAVAEVGEITWVDEDLDTISYSMKAEGFAKKIEEAKMAVYKRTNRFLPNWMLVSPDMMPILTFVPGFKAAGAGAANGPFIAGEIAGMKLIVSPALGEKVCYLGILGADGKTAVGYYMPYMPIVPTQLLGFADGTMEQGFSTVYAMGIINPALMERITVTTGDNAALYKELTA